MNLPEGMEFENGHSWILDVQGRPVGLPDSGLELHLRLDGERRATVHQHAQTGQVSVDVLR